MSNNGNNGWTMSDDVAKEIDEKAKLIDVEQKARPKFVIKRDVPKETDGWVPFLKADLTERQATKIMSGWIGDGHNFDLSKAEISITHTSNNAHIRVREKRVPMWKKVGMDLLAVAGIAITIIGAVNGVHYIEHGELYTMTPMESGLVGVVSFLVMDSFKRIR